MAKTPLSGALGVAVERLLLLRGGRYVHAPARARGTAKMPDEVLPTRAAPRRAGPLTIKKPVSKARNKCLDGLRGYAAFVVVIHHFVAGFWPAAYFRGGTGWSNILSETPLLVFINGPFAVFVFFVLSGYVLAGSKESSPSTLPGQILARYVRLGVPAGLSVVLAYAVLSLGLSNVAEAVQQNGNLWLTQRFPAPGYPWWKATANAAGSYFLTASSPLNQVLWTMRTEFFGSVLIFSVSSLLASARARSRAYIFLSLIALALSNFMVVFYFVPFLSGALLRENGFDENAARRPIAWLFLLIGLVLGGVPFDDASGTLYEPLVTAVSGYHHYPLEFLKILGAILLVLSVIWLRPGFFETRLAAWFGKISFSSYLIHMLVLVSFASYIYSLMGENYLIAQAVIFSAVSLVLASLFYRFIEAPAIAWSGKIKVRQRRERA